jgi:hypothetical protein
MLHWLTEVADFMPHGMCLLWRPSLMALHIVSDGMIAIAYFAIPVAIAVFVRRRRDLSLSHKALALFFAVFITACGLTHVMSIVVLRGVFLVEPHEERGVVFRRLLTSRRYRGANEDVGGLTGRLTLSAGIVHGGPTV